MGADVSKVEPKPAIAPVLDSISAYPAIRKKKNTMPLDSLGSPCYRGPRLSRRCVRWENQKLPYFKERWTC